MMTPRPALTCLAALLLTQCVTPPVPEPEAPAQSAEAAAPVSGHQWHTTHNGVAVWQKPVSAGARVVWQGPVNQAGQAHGLGVLTLQQPPEAALADGGASLPLVTTTHKGGMINGRFEGLVITASGPEGRTRFDRYANGEWVSSEEGEAGQATLSQMPASDAPARRPAPAAAPQPVAQTSTRAASSPAASTPAPATQPAPPPAQPRKRNLIDVWGLRRTQGGTGDHIKFYIMAADEAYESYQKSGSDAYYQQHEQYAELTRAFHERTGGGMTGFSR